MIIPLQAEFSPRKKPTSTSSKLYKSWDISNCNPLPLQLLLDTGHGVHQMNLLRDQLGVHEYIAPRATDI